jgi:hypothetical protein
MQSAGNLVAVLIEFAAGMQFGQRDLRRRPLGVVLVVHLHAGGNAPAVVDDRDAVVGVDGDHDVVAVPRERFIDRVVDHFEHQMVQPSTIGGVSDIHARALAHGFQSFEDLDRALAISLARVLGKRIRFVHRSLRAHASGRGSPALSTRRRNGRRVPPIQMRIGITTYLNPARSGTVINALELLSCSSSLIISWVMLASASIR